jgi:Flp pilus assembly protein TadG
MRVLSGWCGILGRAAGESRGAALVELAFAIPVLTGLLVPVIDIGMGLYQKMEVQDAAQAGAEYAIQSGWNSAAIQSAVTNATGLAGISATPAPSEFCGCPTTTGITVQTGSPPCTQICSGGSVAGTYVTVNATATYNPIMTYPILGSAVSLTAQTTVRIQ